MSAPSNHPPEGPGFSDTPDDSENRWRVGRLLQREREAYDLELRDVASALRIRYAYLLAIEEGRFSDLPGLTYAVGFVRTYADYLELDSDEIVRRFKDEVSGLDRTTQLEFPTPVSEAKVPSGAVILVAVLLLAVAYGGWLYLSKPGESIADLVPELPDRFQSLVAGSEEDDAAGDEAGMANDDMAAAPVMENEAEPPGEPEPAPEAVTETATTNGPAAADGATVSGDSEVPDAPETTMGASDISEIPEATVAGDRSAEPIEDEPVADEPAGVETTGASTPQDEAAVPETAAVSEPGPVSVAEVAEETAEAVREVDSVPVAGEAEVAATGSDAPTGPIDEADAGSAPAIPETSEVAATSETTDEGGRIFGAANTGASVVLHAEQDTWVQVRDGDGNLLLTRILRDGDVYRVPTGEGLTMLVGNAGGLRAEVNGETLGTLGAENQVRRGVPLAAQDLLDWYRSER